MLRTVGWTVLLGCGCLAARAQVTVQGSGIRTVMRIDESTAVFDKETDWRLSYRDYQHRIRADANAYHLEPIYNEYGQAGAYALRPTTDEERTTHIFSDQDTTGRPKIGQQMPLFVMTGHDGNTYRSADLKGRVVVLSLWLTLSRPLLDEKRLNKLDDLLKPYQARTNLLSLGTLSSSPAEVDLFLGSHTLPFVPVPDAYGFAKKFQALRFPTFIVIDKAGQVAAYLEGDADNALKAVLDRVTR